MKYLIPILFLLISCNKDLVIPDHLLIGEASFNDFIEGFNTPDRVKRQACLKTLIYGYKVYRLDLINALGSDSYNKDEKEIIAYVIYNSKYKKDYGHIASYYCKMLQDPNYHTFDYLFSGVGHRHGGSIQREENGIILYSFQYSCPSHIIEDLGDYSIKPLIQNMKSNDLRTRVLSSDTLSTILKIDLEYNPMNSNTTNIEKQLKKLGKKY